MMVGAQACGEGANPIMPGPNKGRGESSVVRFDLDTMTAVGVTVMEGSSLAGDVMGFTQNAKGARAFLSNHFMNNPFPISPPFHRHFTASSPDSVLTLRSNVSKPRRDPLSSSVYSNIPLLTSCLLPDRSWRLRPCPRRVHGRACHDVPRDVPDRRLISYQLAYRLISY